MKIAQLKASSKSHLARRVGFFLAVIAFVFLWVVIFGEGLVGVFRIWADPSLAGTHFVHAATFMTMIWIFGLAMLVQLYRATERVAAMQIALIIASVALLTELPQMISTSDPMLLVFLGPVFIAAALHPARRELLSREAFTEGAKSPVLLALAGLALIPVVVYAVGQMNLQLTLTDEHALASHYSSMAAYGLTFVAVSALAAVGGTGRRQAAYAAGVMAVILGAASMFQPTASAIDGTWSILAILWGLAVVVAFEWSTRRTHARRGELPIEETTPAR